MLDERIRNSRKPFQYIEMCVLRLQGVSSHYFPVLLYKYFIGKV